MPSISIITSLYYSQNYIDEFYARSLASVKKITDDYEFIFVDDGSPDESTQRVRKIIEQDKKVRLIELSRNFGQHKAVMAGLHFVKGDFVFLLDCDLEEKPELLNEFYSIIMQNSDHIDVVYGYMKVREGRFFEKIFGRMFYRVINKLSDITIPEDMLMARLMRLSYVKTLAAYNETHVFIGGLMQHAGFKQVGVAVDKSKKGSTTYTLIKRVTAAIDAIASFSGKPLIYISLSGLLISLISFLFIIELIVKVLFFHQYLAGWPSLIVSLWFIGGLMLSALGVVGLYISKIFVQVKNRPNYIIRNIYN
jgi:putative glycosyltransferase